MFREVKESEWSAVHLARHGVTLDEVREAILERPHWEQPGRDNTVECFGLTYAGRYLFVVATPDDEHSAVAFIITARQMTTTERRLFERKAQ